ncbi:MAG: hypothetical protein GSR82_01955 [Desulfurococcales archaeon]|nr:hypothetical protein [Desulfurococcales archaeon]
MNEDTWEIKMKTPIALRGNLNIMKESGTDRWYLKVSDKPLWAAAV